MELRHVLFSLIVIVVLIIAFEIIRESKTRIEFVYANGSVAIGDVYVDNTLIAKNTNKVYIDLQIPANITFVYGDNVKYFYINEESNYYVLYV
ncbi:hypothetical protein DRN75_02480 [Nanoarchaeota archaeon]|nr:MAG: hypothetical protein DRN75_02480 [Nanoarchaeota archaeon]